MATDQPKTMQVRVLKPFLVKGQRQEVGSTVELGIDLAREMISATKVEPADEKEAEVEEEEKRKPMTTERHPPLVKGKKGR